MSAKELREISAKEFREMSAKELREMSAKELREMSAKELNLNLYLIAVSTVWYSPLVLYVASLFV